jgi:hypothetical protein
MEVNADIMKFFASRLPVSPFLAFLSLVALAPNISAEPLGPSSRRTGLVISELMYHPLPRLDGKNVEFIELYNSEPTPANLSGFQLTGDADFTFPSNTIIPPLSFLVVAPAPSDVQSAYGISGVLGGFGKLTNSLPNDRGTIRLRSQNNAVLLEVNYADDPPWPAASDGAGPSLVLARPSFGEGDVRAWASSALIGGSPGASEPAEADALSNVVINEFLAHTDDPEVDYIELYNHSLQSVDISGCILTDDPATNRFVIPSNTVLAPGGFVFFTQTNLNFSLSAEGETIYFINATQTRVLDAVRFGGQENGVATGRFPDGSSQFDRLAGQTPGSSNAPVRISDVVINEIMYHPISNDADDQYVELFNRSANPVNLGGWQLNDAISFTIPSGAILAPDSYLVIAKDAARLLTNYAALTTNNTVGNFSGKLSGRGERLSLTMPDTIVTTNTTGSVKTNTIHIKVDEVTYRTGGRWPKWPDGGGSSLELIDPRGNHRLASNWADSDESAKAPWTVVQHTGILDNGMGSPDSFQMLLQGSGECLVDDVEVLDSAGGNRIGNSTFETGANGWVGEGTQELSGLETNEGFNSARSFHVRAVERGDDTVNRIRTPLTPALTANATATIRAKVRWLRGHPELLLRLRGNHLEAIGRMTIPKNLGTPGARNSRAMPNTGPAIFEVAHAPVLPVASQPVVVTVRVDDPDGLSQLKVHYRLDPGAVFTALAMTDNGTSGDAIASDGNYSATIPGQTNGALVAFYIESVDNFVPSATSRFPSDAPGRECLIRFGESKPGGSLGTYRIWMTQTTFNTWRNRSKLNNVPLDVTFVSNDQRIIYNTEALYAGSPYISPGYNTPIGTLCGYTGAFPDDDRFLGTTDLVLDWPGRDSTGVQEQAAYWIADQVGLANNYRRFIRLHVNGVTETQRGSIYEDVQQPGSEVIKEWVPDDSDGQLFKIERWFEFSDTGSRLIDPMPTLQLFTTTDVNSGQRIKKLARYRWNWLPRAVKNTANDFTNIFSLVDAVNATAPEPYTSQTEALVDIEQWMGIFAIEHIINNFDSYGHNIGKNMYAYKPENGKWQMHMFDIDWVMLASVSQNYNTNAALFVGNDTTITRMYGHPPFRRAYFRTVKKAVDGPLDAANMNPWLDAKYSALVAEGVTRSAGQNLASPATLKTWIQGRRNYLLQQLATVTAGFSITSNNGNDFTADTEEITLTGTAPIEVKGLRANGVEYPVTWTTVTNWSMRLPLGTGQNRLTLEGYDPAGHALPNSITAINITYNGAVETPGGRVVINEWMAANTRSLADPADGDFDDWFELYNPSNVAVDLTGYMLTDNPSNLATRWTIPSGTTIPANGFLLVWADEETNQTTAVRSDLHAGFKLSQAGEGIALFAPNGRLIDSVTFGTQTNDISQGRWPDGGTNLSFMLKPTPGAANVIPASPPPEIRSVETSLAAGGSVVIVWSAETGKSYRLQFKDDLNAPSWTDVIEVTATGSLASSTNALSAGPQRFYRIQRLTP